MLPVVLVIVAIVVGVVLAFVAARDLTRRARNAERAIREKRSGSKSPISCR